MQLCQGPKPLYGLDKPCVVDGLIKYIQFTPERQNISSREEPNKDLRSSLLIKKNEPPRSMDHETVCTDCQDRQLAPYQVPQPHQVSSHLLDLKKLTIPTWGEGLLRGQGWRVGVLCGNKMSLGRGPAIATVVARIGHGEGGCPTWGGYPVAGISVCHIICYPQPYTLNSSGCKSVMSVLLRVSPLPAKGQAAALTRNSPNSTGNKQQSLCEGA